MAKWFSFAILLGVIAVVGTFFYRVMAGFLVPLFLASILVIMFRPLHLWVVMRLKGRRQLAAAVTTTMIAAVVLLPVVGITTLAALEARSLVSNLGGDNGIEQKLNALPTALGLEYPHAEEIRYIESSLETLRDDARQGATAHGDPVAADRLVSVADQLRQDLADDGEGAALADGLYASLQALQQISTDPKQIGTLRYQKLLGAAADALRDFKLKLLHSEFNVWLTELVNPTADEVDAVTQRIFGGIPGFLRSFGGTTSSIAANAALGMGVMILAVYFFLTDGPAIIESLMRMSPLEDRHERELLEEFDRISRAVVVATLLSAVVQGLLAGVGFWATGLQSVFLLTLTTIVFALIPFVGAATVWVPACMWLYFYEGRLFAAIGLAIYGATIVSMADNVIKPLVLHGQSNLHPLFALLSVLGGVNAVGPIGILVGPMIVVLLQTLLNILQNELQALDRKEPLPSTLPPPVSGT
ncbi:MAG: AI-2E family transporter [Pirellulaceae bacterium]